MARKITFIHTGDIHLGAPIRGLSAPDDHWSARLREAIPEAFDRLIRTAIARQVDFMVIAGDAFDTAKASYGDFARFFDGLRRLHEADIPVYLVAGNHDPYTSWARDLSLLPPSAHLMGVGGPTFALHRREGEPLCLIGARSYFNQTWPEERDIAEGITRTAAERALTPAHPDAAEAPFSLGIIHTGLDIDKRKAPANEQDLLARGIDYWACGHLHKPLVRPDAHNPRIVFPGCIQGRAIHEDGRHGCYQVTLEESDGAARPSLEFLSLASIAFRSMKVDVGPAQTLADLSRHIQAALFRENAQAGCEDMVVRVTLTGQTELYGFLSQPEVLERVRRRLNDAYPSFFCDALVNRTRPPGCGDDGSQGDSFSALVGRIADEQRVRSHEMVNYVQNELVKLGVTVPESLSRRIECFEDAAELRVRRLLEEEPR